MPFARAKSLGRDLTGRNDIILTECLVGQLDATLEGAVLARAVARGDVAPTLARGQMGVIEHRGDDCRKRLVSLLARALAPPMDREDLFRLSRSVDDILDNLRDLVRELDLFSIEEERLLDEPLEGVETGVIALRNAVSSMPAKPGVSRMYAMQARKADIRPRYQQAMAQLLVGDGAVTAGTLKRRELLRRVDVIGLRMGEAANALADGAVKRSR